MIDCAIILRYPSEGQMGGHSRGSGKMSRETDRLGNNQARGNKKLTSMPSILGKVIREQTTGE